MIVFPLVAAGVSAFFSLSLFRQWRRRRRLAHLAWGIALAQFAIASIAVTAGVGGSWDPTLYRIFWLFGALLNVPWLALGSIALVSRKPIAMVMAAGVTALSVYALVTVWGADLNRAVLEATDGIPRGSKVWIGDAQVILARYLSIPAWLAVVGIALWTSRTRKGLRPPRDRVRGNLLIAVGVSIVAVGGFALSRIGRGAAFSITLALGVIVMYLGFMLASRTPRYRVEEPGQSPT